MSVRILIGLTLSLIFWPLAAVAQPAPCPTCLGQLQVHYDLAIGPLSIVSRKLTPLDPRIPVIENSTLVSVPVLVQAKTAVSSSPVTIGATTNFYLCAPNLSGDCIYNNQSNPNLVRRFQIKAGTSGYKSAFNFFLPANNGSTTFYVCKDTGAPYRCQQQVGSGSVAQFVRGRYDVRIASVQATDIRSSGADSLYGIILLAPGGSAAPSGGAPILAKLIETASAGPNSQEVKYKGSSQPVRISGGPGQNIGGIVVNLNASYPLATIVVLNYGASYSSREKASLNAAISSLLNASYRVAGDSAPALIKELNALPWHGCDGPVAVDVKVLPTPDLIRATDFQPVEETVSAESITPLGGGCHTSRYAMTWAVQRTSSNAEPSDKL